jgi:stage V sporulation protein B
MDKAVEIGQVSATGSFRLFIGKALSTIIMAFGTIILTILISEGDYGLYALALVPANTLLLFQDWGVGAAMTKFCASKRASSNDGDLRSVIISGLVFEASTGLLLTLFSLAVTNFVALSIFNKPESSLLITIVSLSVFSGSLLGASQSIFVGFDRMDLYSLLMVLQALAQGFLSPVLVFLGYGGMGAAIGYTSASILVGVVGIFLLFFSILKPLNSAKSEISDFFKTLTPLVHFGLPLALSTLIAGVTSQFYWYVVGASIAAITIGNLKVAGNFAVLLTFVTLPISTVLFPAFSKLNPKNEEKLLKTVFSSSVRYTTLLLIPATMALIVLSEPFIGTVYSEKWSIAPFFLSLITLTNFAAAFGTLSNNSLLMAMGKTRVLLTLSGLTLVIAAPLSFVMIPLFGIPGLMFVSIVASLPSWFIGLNWTWKHYGVKADFSASMKIIFASAIAAFSTFVLLSFLNSAQWIRLVSGFGVFISVYLVATPILGGINQSDTNNLRVMFSGLGPFSRLLGFLLGLVDSILRKVTKSASS